MLGVSPDSVRSHARFARKLGLAFPLLSDDRKELVQACGIWVEKSMYGKTYWGVERTTYLLDPTGRVIRVWRKPVPAGHAEAVAAELQASPI